MSVSPTRLVLISGGLAAAVAVCAFAVILFLRPVDQPETATVHISGVDLRDPWCNDEGTLCVTRESLEQGFALYTVEPHEHFRKKGCRAAWRPDFDLAAVGSQGYGAFRSPCSGATFDRLGMLLFGPSPRALDRYPAMGSPGDFEIAATRLQPGPAEDAMR